MERMHGRGGVYGGACFSYFGAANRTTKKITSRRLIFCHATTNQKHAGGTEGGWDRPRDRARTLGEHDGNDEPFAECNKDNDNEYGKDGNIPDDNNEYAVGVDGVGEPLDESDDQRCPRTSMPCVSAAELALTLRV